MPSETVPLAQTVFEPLPEASGNAFSFVFSNPFGPSTPSTTALPPNRRHHFIKDPIPLNHPIFVDGVTGSSITWGRLRQSSLSVGNSLVNGPLALRPAPLSSSDPAVNRGAVLSPIVLLLLPNSIQFTVLAFGVMAAGLVITGANPALTEVELAHILEKSSPSAIITTPSGISTVQKAFASLKSEHQAQLQYPTRGNIFVVDSAVDDYGASAANFGQAAETTVGGWRIQNWKVLLRETKVPFAPPQYSGDEDDLRAAIIFWSSGTSGKSKGVILSHRALGSALIACWHGSGIKAFARLVGVPPWYHIFGWANNLMVAPALGCTVTLLPKFDPQQYLRVVQDTKATHLHIAPPVAVLLAKSPMVDGFDLSSVKNCTSGGAPLGVSIVQEVYKRLGFVIRLGYGLSETSGVTNQISDSWEEHQPLLGSVGKVFPGSEIKIISVEDGTTVTEGIPGEILIRSPYILRAYLNNPEATAEALDNEGWFHTGDVGKMENELIYIVDRLKEVIKVKGFQVSPAELEDGLCASPLVQDAGVTSIYSEEHATEYPIAYVVPFDKSALQKGPAAEAFAHTLRSHIESKYTSYKWIRGGFVIVPAIPKSPAGKILRRFLKDTKGTHVKVYTDIVRAKL